MQKITTVNAEQFRESVFFSLSVSRWGNRALVKDMVAFDRYRALCGGGVAGAIDGNPKSGNGTTKTTKILLRSEKLEAINAFLNVTKDRLCGRFGKALPSRIKEGLFVVQKTLVQEFEDDLRAAQAKLGELVQEFIAEDYAQAIDRARDNAVTDEESPGLGPLFNPKDYPSTGRLSELFSLDWQWLALGVPEDLPAALRAEAAEKLDRQMTEAAEEVKTALYTQLGEFLDHLVERLSPGESDKPKVFRDSLVENVRSFCAVFEARNFMRDDKLGDLVNRARAVLEGVDAGKIRQYASVRENTREKFTAIKAEIDKAIAERPGRVFDLED